jgi:hypothetical protein
VLGAINPAATAKQAREQSWDKVADRMIRWFEGWS